ncbi:hypothetical protein M3Y97_00910800 [Aphelenchoides bicaudatus]|nr:hypothetical protein M3Y97_00910800 [Aphelenchoides bicaudatus]
MSTSICLLIILATFQTATSLSVITDNTTLNQQINLAKSYSEIVARLNSTCLSADDFKQLYGNKAEAERVLWVGSDLLNAAKNQIRISTFCNFYKVNESDFQNCTYDDAFGQITPFNETITDPPNLTPKVMELLRHRVCLFRRGDKEEYIKFEPQELKTAMEFVDKRIPAVREYFQYKINKILLRKDMQSEYERGSRIAENMPVTLEGPIYSFIQQIYTQSVAARFGNSSICVSTWSNSTSVVSSKTPWATVPQTEEVLKIKAKYNESFNTFDSECLSADDFRQLYGNKSKASLVGQFYYLPMESGGYRIGLERFCKFYGLDVPETMINYSDAEYWRNNINRINFQQNISDPVKLSPEGLIVARSKIKSLDSDRLFYDNSLTPQEIQIAADYMKKRFPEINKLYDCIFEEMKTRTDWKEELERMDWLAESISKTATRMGFMVFWVGKQSLEARLGGFKCRNTWGEDFQFTLE